MTTYSLIARRLLVGVLSFSLAAGPAAPALAQSYPADAMAGKLNTLTLTDTTNISTPYATNGRTRAWTYSWSTKGQLLSVDGPLSGTGDTTTYTYNSDGYLASVTNPLSQTTTISAWDFRGDPTTVVDPNGVTTNLTYDAKGRPLTITVNPGGSQSVYTLEYDVVGNLAKLTLPEGGFLEYTYDAGGRLTEVENDRGQTQTFAVNAAGEPTSLTIKTAGATTVAQQTYAYDELARLIQAVGAGSQTTGFAYDKVSNNTSVTDARGKVFQASFDALDRVITQTNPQSQVVQTAYNAADQLVSHKDGRTLETTRIVDGFGHVIREVSPDRGTISYWYDAAGRLTQTIDGDGQETDYAYDNAGRLTSSTYAGASGETVTYSYDATSGGNKGVGRLTGVTEESGSSAFTYDAQGRLTRDVKTIQSESYTVEYAYDRNGSVTGITLPSGRTVTYTRASDGLASAITTKATPLSSSQNIATSIAYRPFGPLESLTYGNGLSLTRTYDQNYWLGRIEVKTGGTTRLDLSFTRNANGQLTGVTDNASTGRGSTFTYTDAGRLATADGAWGDDDYTYDAAGNRTGRARDVGGTVTNTTLTMASASNRADDAKNGGTTLRTLTYNTGGDLAQDVRNGGPTYVYEYNARKRLERVKQNGTTAAEYGYDYQGRRVWRTVAGSPAVQTHYVFDPDGRLLAEHDGATGDVVREYVWLDDLPIAQIDSAGTILFISTGQVDEPLMMTDASTAKVWGVAVDPYGSAVAFGSPSAGLDQRLPGQWLQSELGGLHQNWMRDYDPVLGRYIQPDPIGLAAGQNPYMYVDGDPLNATDPTGEIAPLVGYAVAATVLFVAAETLAQLHKNQWKWECLNLWAIGGAGARGATEALLFGLGGRTFFQGWEAGRAAAAARDAAARAAAKSAAAGSRAAANRNAGNAFRDELAKTLRDAGRDVETEVLKRTPFGKRFIDIEVSMNGKVLGGVEAKAGGSRYTATQRLKDWWLKNAQGYTVNVARNK